MTDRHLEEAIIQSYLDGELSREQAAATAAHLAACEACSASLAEAEAESSFFAAAFAPDESVSVPTADLRARLNASVARLEASTESGQQHSQGWSFGGFLSSLSGAFTFTPRAAAAFATLLLAVAAGIIYLSSQRSQQSPPAAQVARTEQPAPAPKATTPENVEQKPAPTPEQVGNRQVYVAAKHSARVVNRRPAAPSPNAVKEEGLPGEKEYQSAIASLEKTIKFGGEQSLRPTVRADYERNLALIDSAIEQTRQVAAQNPKDKDAVSFLMTAYRSKVELLTRVADQAQVAALGR
jgi:anti-sigma factor RsiW